MKFQEYIKELSMKKGTKIDVYKGKYEYNAKIELEDGTTWLYNAMDYNGDDEWDIVFYEPSQDDVGSNYKVNKILTKNKPKIALETFAAVEKITYDFIKYHKPMIITFNAQGRSREKLYDLLAKKIVKSGKYELSKDVGLKSAYWRFRRI